MKEIIIWPRRAGKATAVREIFLREQREKMCIAHKTIGRRIDWKSLKRGTPTCTIGIPADQWKQYHPGAPCICGRVWRERILSTPGTIIRFAPIEGGCASAIYSQVTDPFTLNVNGYGKKTIRKAPAQDDLWAEKVGPPW